MIAVMMEGVERRILMRRVDRISLCKSPEILIIYSQIEKMTQMMTNLTLMTQTTIMTMRHLVKSSVKTRGKRQRNSPKKIGLFQTTAL